MKENCLDLDLLQVMMFPCSETGAVGKLNFTILTNPSNSYLFVLQIVMSSYHLAAFKVKPPN